MDHGNLEDKYNDEKYNIKLCTEILKSPIELEEVRQTIKYTKNGAHGPNGVWYGNLKETDDKVIIQMTEDYNQFENQSCNT